MKCSGGVVRVVLCLVALSIAGYIVIPPLYWHLVEAVQSSYAPSCPPCLCDCSSQPIVSIPQGLSNISFGVLSLPSTSDASILEKQVFQTCIDCAKHNPEANADTEHNFVELLSEELKLRETQALENQQRVDMALLDAKKIASQYQKEADKCNSGMETCEEVREKAEISLVAQKKLTALWEQRARLKGWKEGVAKSHTQSQGKVQTT